MIELLAGVPGMLKSLRDRLTTTRAANLDKLDVNVTTRAPANTALSNQVWTDARAAKLDISNSPIGRSTTGIVGRGTNSWVPQYGKHPLWHSLTTLTSSNSVSMTEVLSVSGPGVVGLVVGENNGSSGQFQVELDGSIVFSGAIPGSPGALVPVIGHIVPSPEWNGVSTGYWALPGFDNIPFYSSFKIRLSGNTRAYFTYRTVAAQ